MFRALFECGWDTLWNAASFESLSSEFQRYTLHAHKAYQILQNGVDALIVKLWKLYISCHEVLDWTQACNGQDLVKLPILDWSWTDRFSNMGVSQNGGSMWHVRVVRNAAYDKVIILLIHAPFGHYLNIILWSMNYIYIFTNEQSIFIHIHVQRSLEVIPRLAGLQFHNSLFEG